jgi:hypothetical protein
VCGILPISRGNQEGDPPSHTQTAPLTQWSVDGLPWHPIAGGNQVYVKLRIIVGWWELQKGCGSRFLTRQRKLNKRSTEIERLSPRSPFSYGKSRASKEGVRTMVDCADSPQNSIVGANSRCRSHAKIAGRRDAMSRIVPQDHGLAARQSASTEIKKNRSVVAGFPSAYTPLAVR